MKKIFLGIILCMAFLLSANFVSAETYKLTIRGEPRTPDNKIDVMYDAGAMKDDGSKVGNMSINNEEGYFEVKDIFFGPDERVLIYTQGSCFYHALYITRKNDNLEVTDAYEPEKGVLLSTKETNIDLGVLEEDKSNYISVNTDVGVTFLATDSNNNELGSNTLFKKDNGLTNIFKPHTLYNIIMKDKNGKEWRKSVTTGNYCESTRIVKRRNLLVVETFPNNSTPRIGFFRNIWLFIKSLFY